MAEQDITSVLNEKRVFDPPAEFVRQAHVRGVEDYERLYKEAETDPDTFWQTPHYEGWPAVLIRFNSSDPERVRTMIERSRDWTAAKKPVKPRKKK